LFRIKTFNCDSIINPVFFLLQTVLVLLTLLPAVNAGVLSELPVRATAESPALLLDLGSKPRAASSQDKTTRIAIGDVSFHEADSSIQTTTDEINSIHPGFGSWKVNFQFNFKPGLATNPYIFYARWRQGGDPAICVQSFEIWAGPNASKLEKRAAFSMRPKGWEYAWISSETPVRLKLDDAVIEVRNNGAGHDAKAFDVFLLGG